MHFLLRGMKEDEMMLLSTCKRFYELQQQKNFLSLSFKGIYVQDKREIWENLQSLFFSISASTFQFLILFFPDTKLFPFLSEQTGGTEEEMTMLTLCYAHSERFKCLSVVQRRNFSELPNILYPSSLFSTLCS